MASAVGVVAGPDTCPDMILGPSPCPSVILGENGVGGALQWEGEGGWPLWMQQYAFIDVPSSSSTSFSVENLGSNDNNGYEMRGSGISKMQRLSSSLSSSSSSSSQLLSTRGVAFAGGGASTGGGGGGRGHSLSNVAEAKVL